jgi:hypothetical protein
MLGLRLGLGLGKMACVTYHKPFYSANRLVRGLPEDNTLPPPVFKLFTFANHTYSYPFTCLESKACQKQ